MLSFEKESTRNEIGGIKSNGRVAFPESIYSS